MQRDETLSISSLPLELLAAIFGQLLPSEETAVECDRDDGGGDTSESETQEEDTDTEDDEEDEEDSEGSRGLESKMSRGQGQTRSGRVAPLASVLAASVVCSAWREVIVKENPLWRRLTLARWRVWEDSSLPARRGIDWRSLHIERVRRDKEVIRLLSLLARTSTHHAAMDRLQTLGMDVWEKLLVLMARWRQRPLQYLGRLHNATICMQALTELRIKKEWHRILAALGSGRQGNNVVTTTTTDDEVAIEEGAILIASWEHTRDLQVRQRVMLELDNIADLVRQRLQQQRQQQQGTDMGNDGDGDAERQDDPERVLEAVNATLYRQLRFGGNVNDYMNPNNSFLDRVLATKKGIPITLAVVYSAVCRRLGVHIDMIGMPGHFLVKHTNPSGEVETFIDAFSEGRRLTVNDCREMLEMMGMTFFSPDMLRPVDHRAVYERMLANLLGVYQRLRQTDKLLGVAKQLLILRGENSIEDLLTCGRLHMLLDQFTEARPLIQRVLSTSTDAEELEQARMLMTALEAQTAAQDAAPPKRRPSPDVLPYRVGQVIRHVRHAYRGVIYGWDPVCSATPTWIQEMRVDDLPKGRHQPFYSVLVDVRDKPGNWTTYVAQENIELPGRPEPVEHAQVGAFFTRFDEQVRRFVPNPELCARYPDDPVPSDHHGVDDDDDDEGYDEAEEAIGRPTAGSDSMILSSSPSLPGAEFRR